MSRFLIIGGSSYLGRHLVPLAAASYTTIFTYFQNNTDLSAPGHQLDIRDETAVRNLLLEFRPDVVFNLAGSNRGSQVTSVIRQGTGNLLWAVRDAGARLIHLSTDSIFRGDAAPYDETAVPDPVNSYGRAKADAEAIVQQYANCVIVRTSLIYGLKEIDHGTRWMTTALAQGETVTLFNNQIRNPVWVDSLCAALVEIAHHPYRGILNVAGRQVLTRADFALKILDYWQIQSRDTLTIAPSSGGWPLDCALDLTRATAVLQTALPGVDEVLKTAASERQYFKRGLGYAANRPGKAK